jgi:hypothetical protein
VEGADTGHFFAVIQRQMVIVCYQNRNDSRALVERDSTAAEVRSGKA